VPVDLLALGEELLIQRGLLQTLVAHSISIESPIRLFSLSDCLLALQGSGLPHTDNKILHSASGPDTIGCVANRPRLQLVG
jgi:hypothetical protein